MMTDRIAMIASLDLVTARQEERRQERVEAARAQRGRAALEQEQSSATAVPDEVIDDPKADYAAVADSDDDYTASCSHWRRGTRPAIKRPAGTEVFMRSDILSSATPMSCPWLHD